MTGLSAEQTLEAHLLVHLQRTAASSALRSLREIRRTAANGANGHWRATRSELPTLGPVRSHIAMRVIPFRIEVPNDSWAHLSISFLPGCFSGACPNCPDVQFLGVPLDNWTNWTGPHSSSGSVMMTYLPRPLF